MFILLSAKYIGDCFFLSLGLERGIIFPDFLLPLSVISSGLLISILFRFDTDTLVKLLVGLFKSGRLIPKRLLVVRLLIFAVGRSSLFSLLPLLSSFMGVVVPFLRFHSKFLLLFLSVYAKLLIYC